MSILIFITSHNILGGTYSYKNIPIPRQKIIIYTPTTYSLLKSHKKPNIPPELILNPFR